MALPGHPGSLCAASGSGPLYVVCGDRPGTSLHAVGLDGSIRWSRRFERAGGMLRVAEDGGIWLSGGGAFIETLPTGSPGRRVVPSCLPDERLGSFVVLPDGFLLTWTTSPYRGARVERLDRRGARVWSTPITVRGLGYHGVTHRGVDTGWRPEPMPAWEPRDFTPERDEGLLVSGDRLLATYVETASGLGVGYCLDLGSGDLVGETPPHPTGARAVAGPGRFLVGAQGYGAFETYLYDRDGTVVAEWAGHGRPLVSHRGRIRIVELENRSSSPARLRRLHRDGTMTDGPMLPGYHTVGPVLGGDGRAAFWRDGRLQVTGPDLSVRTLYEDHAQGGTDRMLLLDDGLLVFVLTGDRATGKRTVVFAQTDLVPLDTGPWPCGEGNLQGNPVLPG